MSTTGPTADGLTAERMCGFALHRLALLALLAAVGALVMLAFASSAHAIPGDPDCAARQVPIEPCDPGGDEFGNLEVFITTSPAATTAAPGWDDENLTYTISVDNGDPINPATGATLRSAFTGGASVISSSATQGSCGGGGPVDCTLGNIPAGGSVTVTVVVRPTAGTLVNRVTAESEDVGGGTAFKSNVIRQAAASAAIDWSMPERSRDVNGDGLIDSGPPAGGYVPRSWTVVLNACGSTGGRHAITSYRWEIAGMPDQVTSTCSHTIEVPSERRYPAKLTLNLANGSTAQATRDIRVQDRLIVVMGDSYASGEGNPHVPIVWGSDSIVAPPVWDDTQCHRSNYSGSARAARTLEQDDPRTSVTYLSRACSGATIAQGVLGEYAGVEPAAGPMLPPQVDQVLAVTAGSKIDDLVISVGGNDVGFAPILADCILPGDCFDNTTLVNNFNSALAGLQTSHYPSMRASIRTRLNAATTYITEYPDFTTNASGARCDAIGVDILWPFSINKAEADWASNEVGRRISEALVNQVNVAKSEGLDWRYVGGVKDEWTGPGYGHGYCVGSPQAHEPNRWIRTFTNSCDLQGPPAGYNFGQYYCHGDKTTGHFHPNEAGHMAYARRYLEYLRANPPKIDETAPGDGDGDGDGGGGGGGDGGGGGGDGGGGGLEPLPGSQPPGPSPLANVPVVGGTTAGTPSGGKAAPKRKPGKCSKLRGKKRAKCIKRSCARYKGRSKRAKLKRATCVKAVTRKR